MDEVKEFGGYQSPKDERDFKREDLGTAIIPQHPISWIGDISNIPVYNQQHQPSCSGHAGSSLIGILSNNGIILSPRFVYALCKKIDGIPDQEGTYGRTIMQVLQKYGVCTDALFPNDTSLSWVDYKDYTKIPPRAYTDALNRRIGAYAQLTDLSFEGIKNAIYNHKVVLILARIGKEWWTSQSGVNSWKPEDILPLRPPAQIVSGHFFVDYGYDQFYMDLRNSWGEDWANKGDGIYKDNYSPYIIEAWVADLPTPPPAPTITVNPTPQQIKTWTDNLLEWLSNISQWIKGRLIK